MAVDPAMYLFANSEVGMSRGKLAAQIAHAAVEAYRITPEGSNLLRLWYAGGHYKKLVMDGGDASHLQVIERYLRDRGFNTVLIVDEGHTEVAPLTPTALGVEIVDKNNYHVSATFSTFNVLRDSEEVRSTPNQETSLCHRLCSMMKSSVTKDQSRAS